MEGIRKYFDDYFSNWDIRLPEAAIAERKRGKIIQGEWTIWYLFGNDEHGEFLDYYCSTRWWSGDQHIRVYEDGTDLKLPSLDDFATIQENQEVQTLLEQKGFVIEGNEPMAIRINRGLRLGQY